MKNLTLSALIVISLMASFSSGKKDNEVLNSSSLVTLTQQEKDDLIFLREEEKLARDVYLFSYDKYGKNIFNNIASSEQSHMDKILAILIKYNLPDLSATQRGVFNNSTLQTLYNDLTTQADISQLEALKVGATIEDLDISDIDEFIARSNQADVVAMYEILNCGSRNHIRSYTSQLNSGGVSYTPQFISLSDYQAILASPKENCGQ